MTEVKGVLFDGGYSGQTFADAVKRHLGEQVDVQVLIRLDWQFGGAYEAMKDKAKTGDVLPYNNYPMNIEIGNVYVIDYTKTDKTKMRLFYIADGKLWNGQPVTENIAVE